MGTPNREATGSQSASTESSKDGENVKTGALSAWYCPSRWLMAHHDPFANICTTASHICLADLHGDGENLLALVDFKRRIHGSTRAGQPPFDCRIRVYRGQQLIYNHFLDDLPSSMVVSSIYSTFSDSKTKQTARPLKVDHYQTYLTVSINDDIYFYDKLKPSHKLSLEDDRSIEESLQRSEIDAWKMVKQNKVDIDALKELLTSLNNELGNQQLTSHTNNFLALKSNSERKNYLLSWKIKKIEGRGEHLMSMDTICCTTARHKFPTNNSWLDFSPLARSDPVSPARKFGWTDRYASIINNQRDGLIVGTEDRHLIVYELCTTRAKIEFHHRLPSVPDHILVEPYRSPDAFDTKVSLGQLTYKVVISCRNRHIYSINMSYIAKPQANPEVIDLIFLKSNVVQLCWADDDAYKTDATSCPFFIAACLDRRVHCFSSVSGHCKWVVVADSPVTSVIGLSTPIIRSQDVSLIGIASQANRIDFYTSSNGRIVDSIYISNDYCQAMTFGRFGREDNCLVVATKKGHLIIFIMKRTARFTHNQCLSSAASYASDTLFKLSLDLKNGRQQVEAQSQQTSFQIKLNEPTVVPSAFNLTKSSLMNHEQTGLDSILHSDHNCEQTLSKTALDAYLVEPRLQIPSKNRDFVTNIVDQSRNSIGEYRLSSTIDSGALV